MKPSGGNESVRRNVLESLVGGGGSGGRGLSGAISSVDTDGNLMLDDANWGEEKEVMPVMGSNGAVSTNPLRRLEQVHAMTQS